MQQMPYWAIYLVIRKARGAQYVSASFSHPHPLASHRAIIARTLSVQDSLVAHTAHDPQPRRRDLDGLVPFLGDVLLGRLCANSRNAALLEEFLRHRGEGTTRTTTETSAPADEGIGVRDERVRPRADQDLDDSVTVPLERKRSGLSQKGTGGFLDDKGESLGAPQPVRHRDSRL